jgi:hypothetical protein
MKVSSMGGGDPIGAKGVASMELTVGSKTLATTFFVSEVQGNFRLILGHDWIHVNQCVPSTLHQLLIQWIGDEIEVRPVRLDCPTSRIQNGCIRGLNTIRHIEMIRVKLLKILMT